MQIKSAFFCLVGLVVSLNSVGQSLDQLITTKEYTLAREIARDHITSDVTSVRAKGYWALGVILLSEDPDSALSFLQKAEGLTTETVQLIKVKNAIGNYYDITGNTRHSLDVFLSIMPLAVAVDSVFLSSVFNNLSIGYRNLGMFDSAVYYGIRGLEIAKRFDSKQEQKRINNTIAISFAMQGQLEQAKGYFTAALNLAETMNDSSGMVKYLTNIAQALIYQDSLQKAEQVVIEAAAYLKDSRNVLEITDQYYLLAEISMESGAANQALSYLDQSLELLNPTSFISEKASVLLLETQILLEQEKWRQVEEVIATLDHLLEGRELFDFELSLLKLKRDLLLKKGSLHELSDIQSQIDALSDEKYNRDQAEIIRDLEVRYQTEQKQQEIESLKAEQEISSLQITNQRIIFLSVLVIMIAAGFAVYNWLRRKQLKEKHNKLLAEQRLLRSQMNPHFLFNALAGLHDFVYSGDKWQASEYLASLSKLSREILDYSSQEWILLQQELEILEKYVFLQQLRFPYIQYRVDVDETLEINNMLIPPMILQPFVENAFEHAFDGSRKGVIDMVIQKEANILEIRIDDNGSGLNANSPKEKDHVSKAIQITRDRFGLLYDDGSAAIDLIDRSAIEEGQQGVRVWIKIPIREAL